MKKKILRFLLELVIGAVLAIGMISMVIMASVREMENLNNAAYVERD